MIRCVSIDWLEVYALEPTMQGKPDAEFFRTYYNVEQRAYGTPMYQEMFTILEEDKPFLEVRRKPYSVKGEGGIFDPRACHLRLVNRACYVPDPVGSLRRFMLRFGYEYVSLSRIDICMDFNNFDEGDNPQKFVNDFLALKYRKINQCKIAAHGVDKWDGINFNSLKWGTNNSPISTKIYNKSLELSESKDKPYIRQAWRDAGLDETRPIWRVEFSVKSKIKNYVKLDTGEVWPNTLSRYDDKHRLIIVFLSLASKYFHFKKRVYLDNGNEQRKDRCPDKVLFRYHKDDIGFLALQHKYEPDLSKVDKMIIKRLKQIMNNNMQKSSLRRACEIVVAYYASHRTLPPGLVCDDELRQLYLDLEE